MLTLLVVVVKIVSSCDEGYFLKENGLCTKCPSHCTVCNSLAYCLTCTDGYWGATCELPCSRCQQGTSCEKTNGYCFYKCKEGYSGILCDAVCNEKCLSCDRMNAGLCEKCSLKLYGTSCDKLCLQTCYDMTCDRQNGACINGCDGNYTGSRCNLSASGILRTYEVAVGNKAAMETLDGLREGIGADIRLEEFADGTETKPNDGDGHEGLPNSVKVVLIVFGSVVGLVVVTVVAFVILRRRNARQKNAADAEFHVTCKQQAMVTSNKTFTGKLSAPLEDNTDNELPTSKLLQTKDAKTTVDTKKKNLATPSVAQNIGLCVPHITDGPRAFRKSSYVYDFTGKKAYIVCKDPTNYTNENESTFWKVVWEEECDLIIKLSRTGEETPMNTYWKEKKKPVTHCAITVTYIDETFFDEFTQRTFDIGTLMSKRQVLQMHFPNWPEDRFPEDEMFLLTFRQKVQTLRREQTSPL